MTLYSDTPIYAALQVERAGVTASGKVLRHFHVARG